MTRLPIIALLAASLTACASVPVEAEQPIANGIDIARAVKPCTTTLAQLETSLGRPSRDGRLGSQRLLTWIVAWEPLVRYLGVMVDARGSVLDVYWDVPSEVAWVPTDRCAGG